MYTFFIIVHVLACIFLILVILLQAGRGGGLTETFGGGIQNVLGTKSATFLTKLTTAFAILFLITSLSLAMISARRGRSLMEAEAVKQAQEATKQLPQKAIPVEEPKAEPSEIELEIPEGEVETEAVAEPATFDYTETK